MAMPKDVSLYNGIRVKVSTIVAIVAILTTIGLAGFGGAVAWGKQEGKITALQERVDAGDKNYEKLREQVQELSNQGAATQQSVISIKEQQMLDRQHLDTQIDRLFDAIQQD